MASACFSPINGSLALSTRSDGRLSRVTLIQAPRSLRSLRPVDLCALSFRKGLCRNGFSGVVQARAELSTEELEAVDTQVEESDSGLASDEESAGEDEGMKQEEEAKLYVGNLPWSCTSAELAECFQKVGSVELVEVIYDRESGRSRGFGFVTMSTMEEAKLAIERLDGADFAGRTLRVNFPIRNKGDLPPPRPRTESNNANKLFVGNLAWSVDDALLEQIFSEHGKVVDARVVNDRETGRSRGFGFVTMASEADVNEALNKMDGALVEGRNLRVNSAGDRPAARTDFF